MDPHFDERLSYLAVFEQDGECTPPAYLDVLSDEGWIEWVPKEMGIEVLEMTELGERMADRIALKHRQMAGLD